MVERASFFLVSHGDTSATYCRSSAEPCGVPDERAGAGAAGGQLVSISAAVAIAASELGTRPDCCLGDALRLCANGERQNTEPPLAYDSGEVTWNSEFVSKILIHGAIPIIALLGVQFPI
jgi:hypothetical protein